MNNHTELSFLKKLAIPLPLKEILKVGLMV